MDLILNIASETIDTFTDVENLMILLVAAKALGYTQVVDRAILYKPSKTYTIDQAIDNFKIRHPQDI